MKKLKILIPVFGIMFALVASAFSAQELSPLESDTSMIGYIQNDNPTQPCNQVIVDCDTSGQLLCTYSGKPVYQVKSGTSCFNQLRRD